MKYVVSKISIYILLWIFPTRHPIVLLEDWTFQKEENGIKVYTRPSQVSKFNEIKAEFDIQTTTTKLITVISSVDKYPLWVYGTKKTQFMERLNNEEIIYHSEISAPWPFSNRDFYSKLKIHQDPGAKSLTITATGLPNYKPAEEGIVRVPYLHSYWVVTSISPTTLHVVYTTNIDAGGEVPAWLINLFSTRGPIESFTKLKQRCSI
jgi:hypothetical protein